MSRREFPAKVKVAAFERAGGRCEKCTSLLLAGRFHYDHRVPDALGGEPTLENVSVLCASCHQSKTATVDVPAISKADRIRAKHLGAKPKARPSRWKRKINGRTVLRGEE